MKSITIVPFLRVMSMYVDVVRGLAEGQQARARGLRTLRALLLPVWACIASGLSSCGDRATEVGTGSARHVILISLDTTRVDYLSPWGGAEDLSPAIGRLAEESVVFRDVQSPAPTTLAAHTSIMTGRSPRSHGTPRNGFSVNPDNQTMAELLGAGGFRTLAVIGSFALESLFGLDQGFARYDEEFGLEYSPGLYDQNQRRADQVTRRALELIDAELKEDEGASVFLFAHYFDPLLAFLDSSAQQKFIRPQHRETLLAADTAEDLIAQLETYQPPQVDKWLDFEPRDSNRT